MDTQVWYCSSRSGKGHLCLNRIDIDSSLEHNCHAIKKIVDKRECISFEFIIKSQIKALLLCLQR